MKALGVFVSVAVLVCAQLAYARADGEEVDMQAQAQADSGERAQGSVLDQLVALTGEPFTVEAIQEAGITDRAFAQAVYDSIIADPDNFKYDIKVIDVGEYDYVPGPEGGIQRTAEEILELGTADKITPTQMILSYFTGTILAVDKGIEDIAGIKNLRRAFMINLRNNEIRDIRELEIGKNHITEPTERDRYFGEGELSEAKGRNVYFRFRGNPICQFASELDGRIDLLDLDATYVLNLPSIQIMNVLSDHMPDGWDETVIPIDLRCDDEAVQMNGQGLIYPDSVKATIDCIDGGKWQKLEQLKLKNLRESEESQIEFGMAGEMTYHTIGTGGSQVTEQGTSFKWRIPFSVKNYASIQVESETVGSVRIVKQSETGETLSGAVFSLHRYADSSHQSEDPSFTVVEETTDSDGMITFGQLAPGDYYVQEEQAPEGYQMDDTKHEFTVSAGSMVVENRSRGTSSETGDQQESADGNGNTEQHSLSGGVYVLGGGSDELDLQIAAPEGGTLESITVSWNAGVLDGEAGSETYTGSEEEIKQQVLAKMKSCAADCYQNVTVKGTFSNDSAAGQEIVVTNEKLPDYTLSVRKEDEGSKPLEGAEFTLYRPFEEGTDDEAFARDIVVDGEKVKVIADQTRKTSLVSGSDPQIAAALFEGLGVGTTWYLEETEVPSGYHKMDEILTIEATAEGILVDGKLASKTGEDYEYYITLTNYGNVSIPVAGMGGIGGYTLAGGILLAASLVAGALVYRRRRSWTES